MDRLWAPWRHSYVSKTLKGCLFCSAPKQKKDKALFIVSRSKFSFSILNKYPYNNGHLMIAPFRHVKDLNSLSDEEMLDIIKLLNKTKGKLDTALRPQGYNVGINMGKCAGAGSKHLHIHIVPRWLGDVNFMPIFSDAKVISQSLKTLYSKLTYEKNDRRKRR